MKNVLVGIIFLGSFSTFANESTRLKAMRGLEGVLNSAELTKCINMKSPLAYSESCQNLRIKVPKAVAGLMREIKIEMDDEKNKSDSRKVLTVLDTLLEEIASQIELSNRLGAVQIEGIVKASYARLRRSEVMGLKCVNSKKELVLSGQIVNREESGQDKLFINDGGRHTPVSFEFILHISKDSKDTFDSSEFHIMSDELDLEMRLSNTNVNPKIITKVITTQAKVVYHNRAWVERYKTLNCSLTGSGF